MTKTATVPVFDIGGVLLDWNPRYLYRKLFDDEAAMEEFLATVCTSEWNRRMDGGDELRGRDRRAAGTVSRPV